MKHYCSILILLVLLVFSTAFANIQRFTKEKTYSNNFSDVQETSWYYDSVKEVYELNLFNGVSSDSFGPNSNITIAQAIKLASTIHNIYNNYNESFTAVDGEKWYRPYVEYALNNKIIANEYLDYNANATRSELVKILINSLPDEELKPINEIETIPDISKSDNNGENIYKFYTAGILSGSDKQGTFNPQSNIKRCEVAAIITRLVNPQKRLSFSIKYDPLAEFDYFDEMLGINVKDYSYVFSGNGNQTITDLNITFDDRFSYYWQVKFEEGKDFSFKVDGGDLMEAENCKNGEVSTFMIQAFPEAEKIEVLSNCNWAILIVPVHGKTDTSISGKGKYISGLFIPSTDKNIATYSINSGNADFWIKPMVSGETGLVMNSGTNTNEKEEVSLTAGVPYYFDIRASNDSEWTISVEPKNDSSDDNNDNIIESNETNAISSSDYSYMAINHFAHIRNLYNHAEPYAAYVYAYKNINGEIVVIDSVVYFIGNKSFRDDFYTNLTTGTVTSSINSLYNREIDRTFGADKISYMNLKDEVLGKYRMVLQSLVDYVTNGKNTGDGVLVTEEELNAIL